MPTPATHLWKPSCARRVTIDGFVPVPRGAVPALPAPLVWPAKDPSDVLDYEVDIGPVVLDDGGDAIATIDVTITPSVQGAGDLALTSSVANGTRAILWLTGGQPNVTYAVQLVTGTVGGRTIARTILLPVQTLAGNTPPSTALTTETGSALTDQNGNPILLGS